MNGTTFEQLPIDANGIMQGAWRLVHRSPTFGGTLGLVSFVGGLATEPVCGRPLRLLIAEHGRDLYLEPWGELPRGFTMPECVDAVAPLHLLARLPVAPWRIQAPEPTEPTPDPDAPPPSEPNEAPVEGAAPTGPQLMPGRRRRAA